MATAEYWAEAVIVREQRTLFSPTLDEMIDRDHEVRLLDEALRLMDWTEWENVYKRERGQPPIHPRVIAALWHYGRFNTLTATGIEKRMAALDLQIVDDEKLDQYFCPMGRVLKRTDKEIRNEVLLTRYISLDCSGCPLASKCLQKHKNPESRRSICRNELEQVRHRTAERMATPEGRAIYDNRSPIAETPFGYLKGFLGHCQFLRSDWTRIVRLCSSRTETGGSDGCI